jgi:hypothetical protein
MVGVFTGEGALGAVLARDLELQRCELGFHFLVGLGDFGAVHGGAALRIDAVLGLQAGAVARGPRIETRGASPSGRP